MLSFKEYFLKIKTNFPFEVTHNTLLIMIVMSIIMTASYALFRPVNTQQFEQIGLLKNQHTLPKTQAMAHHLALKDKISNADFYRLMYAYHYESSHIKEYPALNIEDVQ